jgi:hypothetical protein
MSALPEGRSPSTASTSQLVRVATAAALAFAAALHLAWGRGSTFPFSSAAALTDNVVGAPRTPSPSACYSVAAGLAATAALVALPKPGRRRRVLVRAAAAVFAIRAAFGFLGRTDVLVPGSSSSSFRRNDRRFFSPACSILAIGMAAASTPPR